MKITGAVLDTAGLPQPFAESRPAEIRQLELAEPGPGEVLVKMESAGLCHSDLSVVNGARPRKVPLVLGHEAAGRVAMLGAGVDDLAVGQLVTMTFLPRCEECAACATAGRMPCSVGTASNGAGTLLEGAVRISDHGRTVFHHNGVSGFASHAVVDRRTVVPVDNDVPPDVAALLGCAVLTGGGAVLNVAKPGPGDSIAVIGLGGVGMAAILVAASLEQVRVIGVDVEPRKLGIAKELGAHEVYTPDQMAELGIRASHTVEAAGNPSALELAFSATQPGGRTVTVGLPNPKAEITLSPLTITAETRSLIGSYLGSSVPSRDIPRYVDLWRAGRLPVEKLISSHIRLQDLNTAFDELATGSVLRQMISFE
ncbi:alcohol dehydrogenase catalytic domain-containing protein [Arthrobacter sp. 2MCAF15]|uniref:alcohol dehydrogenase catalytic domain-containing protein n=1 Tax=Arthrobacter sp. 2MCAF15 TaxID=3232984 RepID=UPI003F92AB40